MQTHLLEHKASLSKIRRLIRVDLVKAGAAPSAVFDCLLAVSEACAEAFDGSGDAGPTRVSWSVDRSGAEFRIEGLTEPPVLGLGRTVREVLGDIENLGDLGESVIESLMDEVVFEERPGTLVLRKRLR